MVSTNNAANYTQWTIPGVVSIKDIAPDYPIIHISNAFATASIALHGAHVLSYQAHDQEPLLWLSRDAVYKKGKAIRGGIPICWPWFGDHPNDASLPAHGFARQCFWHVVDVVDDHDKGTSIVLRLTENDETLALFPFTFELELTVVIRDTLDVQLRIKNTDTDPFHITSALHTYLAVNDITQTCVRGLEDVTYLDKLAPNMTTVCSDVPIMFDGEMDRVYLQTSTDISVDDEANDRTINVTKKGSGTTVVWNPWHDKSAAMSDFHRDGFKNMVCIEAANAANEIILLHPGESHILSTGLMVE